MGAAETLVYLLVAFALSATAGYVLTTRKRVRLRVMPEVGATLRLRSTSGVYRSKLIGLAPDAWTLSAPLSRNHYVPLRVGDRVTVEAPVRGGVYLFKTTISDRTTDEHELRILPPMNVLPRDRRELKRYERHEPAKIEGQPAFLVDISAWGARLKALSRFKPGERIRLDLEDGMVFAWVLECWPTRHGDEWKEVIRVRFESALDAL